VDWEFSQSRSVDEPNRDPEFNQAKRRLERPPIRGARSEGSRKNHQVKGITARAACEEGRKAGKTRQHPLLGMEG